MGRDRGQDPFEIMSFKPNDKVVCVETPEDYGTHVRPNGPVIKGQVYCVTEIAPDRNSVKIAGKPTFFYGFEAFWIGRLFRLVSEVGHPEVNLEEVNQNASIEDWCQNATRPRD
jgi:hypothetical protein